jgi:hypothetical protein
MTMPALIARTMAAVIWFGTLTAPLKPSDMLMTLAPLRRA